MPQMGESITEGTITKWLKKVGDTVQRDEPIFEISTDKVDAEIPSPVAGVLTEIKVPEGSTVQINTVVAVIGGAAGKAAAARCRLRRLLPQLPHLRQPLPLLLPAAASEGERVRSSPLVRKIAKDNNVDLAQVPGTGAAGRITKSGHRRPPRRRREAGRRGCHRLPLLHRRLPRPSPPRLSRSPANSSR